MPSLHDALGGMRDIPQWFLWRLEWDATQAKYLKTPCAPDGSVYRVNAGDPSVWCSYLDACWNVQRLRHTETAEVTYTLGFWFTADCGYWFLDIDKAVVEGALLPFASQMIAAFPGALVEWSSSNKGVHIIGRGVAPLHRTKPPKEIKSQLFPLELEFYTEGRGIAFGLTGEATGSADSVHDAMVSQLCAAYFPPREVVEVGARPEWRGPTDDDELIRRALAAKPSAESVFGGKASFAQLWRGEVELNSEHDMALASHLAFWTGCDAERIERLMRKSGLVRDKWNAHRTYLTMTITNACDSCANVYQEPQRVDVQSQMYATPGTTLVAGDVVTPEMKASIEAVLDVVSACGDAYEIHNKAIPLATNAGIPKAFIDQVAKAIKRKLDLFDAPIGLPQLRSMLRPPMVAGSRMGNDVPVWVKRHCYVKEGDYFFNLDNGGRLTVQGFAAEYTRLMPLNDAGRFESPVDWALNRWGMTTVHRVAYRPDMPEFYQWDGLDYANSYVPSSVPATATAYSNEGIAGIAALQAHLYEMCGKRDAVYKQLIYWCAHNVQHPGVKVRWSPIIKGAPGDGKSLLSNVLRSAMGYRNVGVTGNSTLTASGGFNDWAIGCAVNIIEEIWLVGKERHRLYNATKEFITNDIVNINSKGARTFTSYNSTNHLAYSNHNDAIPLEEEDRRWLVIFTPWANLPDMMNYCGLTPEGWRQRTGAIDYAWRNCGGELRAWFLSMPIGSDFNKDGSALVTPERGRMLASSKDDVEAIASAIILDGALGITPNVVSSNCLSNLLKIRAITDGYELPKGPAMNHMFTRMGFSKFEKQVKWRGSPHTIWLRNGVNLDNDGIRSELDKTLIPEEPQ